MVGDIGSVIYRRKSNLFPHIHEKQSIRNYGFSSDKNRLKQLDFFAGTHYN